MELSKFQMEIKEPKKLVDWRLVCCSSSAAEV